MPALEQVVSREKSSRVQAPISLRSIPVSYEIDPRELVELRLQLVKELEQVEALEQQLAEQMTPQTVQEVEMLETKFQDALGELKALKGRMKAG